MESLVIREYTQELYEGIWDIESRDYEQDYDSDEVLEKLNAPDFFRPFSERLLAFYNEVLNSNYTVDEARADLTRRAKQGISRGTITNWFSGKGEPKYGDDDRQRVFAVAFAIELDAKQTERLFHKVFLDKAFNKRNVHEFIYLYCINHRKPLSVAEKRISQLGKTSEINLPADQTQLTQYLADAAEKGMDESALLKFIAEHPHNFSLNNTSAKEHRKKLLDKLTIGSESSPGLAEQEYERRRSEIADDKESASGFSGKDKTSVDFLLYMIMGIDLVQKKNDEVLSIRERFQRKEINNQFPDKQTLSMKDPSSYVLRKDIILLYFYSYWIKDYLENQSRGNYDGFANELNGVLFECGFSPLYYGNPYDWLFLYCSACADDNYKPLDRFRGILTQD